LRLAVNQKYVRAVGRNSEVYSAVRNRPRNTLLSCTLQAGQGALAQVETAPTIIDKPCAATVK